MPVLVVPVLVVPERVVLALPAVVVVAAEPDSGHLDRMEALGSFVFPY